MGLHPIKGHRWPLLLNDWGLRSGEAGMFILLEDQMIGKSAVDDFLCTLGSNLPPTENGDSMRWKLTKNGDFDI